MSTNIHWRPLVYANVLSTSGYITPTFRTFPIHGRVLTPWKRLHEHSSMPSLSIYYLQCDAGEIPFNQIQRSHYIDDDSEWRYHYVNMYVLGSHAIAKVVDRDMCVRYVGGGVGHYQVEIPEEQDPPPEEQPNSPIAEEEEEATDPSAANINTATGAASAPRHEDSEDDEPEEDDAERDSTYGGPSDEEDEASENGEDSGAEDDLGVEDGEGFQGPEEEEGRIQVCHLPRRWAALSNWTDSRESQVPQEGGGTWETVPSTLTGGEHSQPFGRDGNSFPTIVNAFPTAYHRCDHIAMAQNSGQIRRVPARFPAFGDVRRQRQLCSFTDGCAEICA
ncbi:hypothetical protein B0H16DRAFT_1466156 [Mycena metata]|uniref:Uncharacterized protein n=1 Tax=Mycena metata TaxID=1033252 RepID=A0AAD7I9X2_9AGAR|nr:hypothetical protein B0H16DRAFT_1466156 [Mycena metata]